MGGIVMAKFGSLRKLPSGRWEARYTVTALSA